jgi:3-hydroxybutyryl-CoA dehydratase
MMATPILPNRIPQGASVGARASFTRTLTEADAALFIGVTWDINPLHTDESYARATRFKRRILPGLLTASLLTHLGGLWAFMATEMRFEFLAPVYPGETITALAEVIEADPSRNWVRLRCACTNQDGVEVLRGDVHGYPGRYEE